MFLVDCHMHTNCSKDGTAVMSDMVDSSVKAGMAAICFTDHCDFEDEDTGEFDPNYLHALEPMLKQYSQVPGSLRDEIEIYLGLEVAELNRYPELSAEIAERPELDFIIGSLHALRDERDFYWLSYKSEEHCYELLDKYLMELLEIARLPSFDVLAHIGYTRRYMLNAGFNAQLSLKRHGDKLETLLKRLIDNGKGIEINMSGFRHPGIKGPIPSVEILKLYRELGGEVITIGSDSHTTSHAGGYIREGYDILRGLGFEYVSVFKKREAEFYKI